MVLKTGIVFVFCFEGSLTLSLERWRAAPESAPPSAFSQDPWSSTYTSVTITSSQTWLTGPVSRNTALPDLNTRTPAWWGQTYRSPSWSPWSSCPGRSSHTGSEDSGKHIIIITCLWVDLRLMNECLWTSEITRCLRWHQRSWWGSAAQIRHSPWPRCLI